MRQFSLTSSQANGGLEAAIPAYKDDPDWIYIAEIVYGADWRGKLLPQQEEEGADGHNEEDTEDPDEDENGITQGLNPLRIQEYLSRFIIPEDASPSMQPALRFLKQYVFDDDEQSDSDASTAPHANQDTEGAVIESEDEAKAIFEELARPEKKIVQEILVGQIEKESFRKK